MDFMMVSTRSLKKDVVEIYPKFIVGKESKDLLILGGNFLAIWIEDRKLWSTDENDAIQAIDNELDKYAETHKDRFEGQHIRVLHLWDTDTGMINKWKTFCEKQYIEPKNFPGLDSKLVFANTEVSKLDYSSKRLPYALEKCPTPAYDELISKLYSPNERRKLEWAIGAVVTGASKSIQKFLVLYGPPKSGKSTFLKIVEKLFQGYYIAFDAESLGSATNDFALEQFRSNPLVGISHDGDLSKIERNTRLNSLTSHERMVINVKHMNLYSMEIRTFLFMGTNKPVKITDAKSGIIRRLIDVRPTGDKFSVVQYNKLMKQIAFELGGIAWRCKEVFESDPNYYDNYKPILMMGESNDFYNYVLDQYQYFSDNNGVTLKNAWARYNQYCEDARVPYPFTMRVFKSELSNYFRNYDERIKIGDEWFRSYFSDFKTDIFQEDNNGKSEVLKEDKPKSWVDLKELPSVFDDQFCDCLAQYANEVGTPFKKWENVKTKLKDIDTSKLHYIKPPDNLVVIDLDYKDESGNKSLAKNLEAANNWPPTYAEVSKSGAAIHLHYIYSGDVSKLENRIDEGTEIKVFQGNSSLRRKLSLCNDLPINPITSGLPMKGEKNVVEFNTIKNEKALRTIIIKNLKKEYHGSTTPSINFIQKVLEDAYNSGMEYNVEDLYPAIISFAANSSNQAEHCIKLVQQMKFKSEKESAPIGESERPIVIFDCESFPNLFLVNWKKLGENEPINRWINPTSKQIEKLMSYRLVGFNNRKYDNHMIYGCYLGEGPYELNKRSQRIINGESGGTIGKAYNISYTDIYDFASAANKMSLKKWEIELGILHKELGFDWTKPVPEEKWHLVSEYCDNDVISAEAVWNHLKADYMARLILADLAEMTPNDTTNSLTAKIVFGDIKHPQLNYTDLKTGEQTNPIQGGHKDMYIQAFPDYEFVKEIDPKHGLVIKKNMFHGTDLGFGGLVISNPGMYGNVALLDVSSMHPHSIQAMDAFGEFTKNYYRIVEIRLMIKHGEFDKVRSEFGGKLAKYIDDKELLPYLADALKTAINAAYGVTFERGDNKNNPFKDNRNENNFIALRGALFMATLAEKVEEKGFIVAHVKTDSIKIPDATNDIISFVMDFGKQYGYTFEHEATYDRMCLVNKAVYIAKYADKDWCQEKYGYIPSKNKKSSGEWTATGAQFQNGYVYKTCFTHDPLVFRDLCEPRAVKSALYLIDEDDTSKMKFVGKVGLFCPIRKEDGGRKLMTETIKKGGEIGYNSVTGCKDYYWIESEELGEDMSKVDLSYFNSLVKDAKEAINLYGDYEWFVSEDKYVGPTYDERGAPVYRDTFSA